MTKRLSLKFIKRIEILCLLIFIFNFLIINFVLEKNTIFYFLIKIVFAFIFSEIILRVLLLIKFGKNYKYKIYPYYLINDNKCGYKFRSKIKSKDINFSIFDRYAFPHHTKLAVNLELNRSQRVIFSTDKFGYRASINNQNNKQKDTLRIVCSGGSTTSGQGINDNETWPFKLYKHLHKSFKT